MSFHDDHALRFGVCWYPDTWPRERWAEDLRLMREAGIQVIRWGEGSWTAMEPSEGVFDWSMVDEVLALAAEAGLGVILGTPTYAPPAWLEQQYPEAIAAQADGSRWYRHGRRMYDYTNVDYRRRCHAIVSAMAERYAADERVWAWQVDNELFCHLDEFYGESVLVAFQDWLRARYPDVADLNRAWGLTFWSNQLDDHAQADLPGPTVAHYNHHQVADYQRFISDLGIGFLVEQIEVINAVNASALVMHNLPFPPVDRAELLGHLDAYGHDHYPAFASNPADRPAMGLNFGRFRGYAERLWVAEQQASQVGQTSYRKPLAGPGELAVTALQSIGHGANLLCWFRWRSFPAAQETNWGGLLPHWGTPGRHYAEAQELIAALAPHAQTIANAAPRVTVARLVGFRQWLAHRVEPWIADGIGDPEDAGRKALRALGLNENQLRPGDVRPGDQYQVALLPHAVDLDPNAIAALTAWVEAGGTLVVGPLAGHRNDHLQAPWQDQPPGLLAPLTGTSNGESTTWEQRVRVYTDDGAGRFEAGNYAEIIEPVADDVEIVARYDSGWFAGRSAITRRQVGHGQVIHAGVPLEDALLEWAWVELRLAKPECGLVTHDRAAEVLTRDGNGYSIHFAINHGEAPAVCYLYHDARDLVSGEDLTNSFTLGSHDWRILIEEH